MGSRCARMPTCRLDLMRVGGILDLRCTAAISSYLFAAAHSDARRCAPDPPRGGSFSYQAHPGASTMTPTLSGAAALIRALEHEGVDVIFGVPGGAILPVYDPILDSPIRHVLARHEQGAGHMASGYRPRVRSGRCDDGDIGPGSDQPHHPAPGCPHGLDSRRRHHRPGPHYGHRQRRIPGGAHLGHLDAVHQAQLPRHRRRRHSRCHPRGIPPRVDRAPGARARRPAEEHPQRRDDVAPSRHSSTSPGTSRS